MDRSAIFLEVVAMQGLSYRKRDRNSIAAQYK
jgi:hypothetical protein